VREVIRVFRRPRFVEGARIEAVRRASAEAELPVEFRVGELWLVGSPVEPKWAVFQCPCATGYVVRLNLSTVRRPRWRVEVGRAGPSVYPSVDADHGGGRCHYLVRSGKVWWATDSTGSRIPPASSASSGTSRLIGRTWRFGLSRKAAK
jgi:hypothetical protein